MFRRGLLFRGVMGAVLVGGGALTVEADPPDRTRRGLARPPGAPARKDSAPSSQDPQSAPRTPRSTATPPRGPAPGSEPPQAAPAQPAAAPSPSRTTRDFTVGPQTPSTRQSSPARRRAAQPAMAPPDRTKRSLVKPIDGASPHGDRDHDHDDNRHHGRGGHHHHHSYYGGFNSGCDWPGWSVPSGAWISTNYSWYEPWREPVYIQPPAVIYVPPSASSEPLVWDQQLEQWIPQRPISTDPILNADSLGRAMSDPGTLQRYSGGLQVERWNPPPLVGPGTSVPGAPLAPQSYPSTASVAPAAANVVASGAEFSIPGSAPALTGAVPVVQPDPELERARAARERRMRLNSVYDVVPDVAGAASAAADGSYPGAVQALRRAAIQNPDALVAHGTPLDLALANDPALAQRVRWTLDAFANPARASVSQADALFAAAVLRAALDDRAGALSAARDSHALDPDRVSTRALIEALGDAIAIDGPGR